MLRDDTSGAPKPDKRLDTLAFYIKKLPKQIKLSIRRVCDIVLHIPPCLFTFGVPLVVLVPVAPMSVCEPFPTVLPAVLRVSNAAMQRV